MCLSEAFVNALNQEEKKVFKAVGIIIEFGPDIKAIREILKSNADKIECEIVNRKEAIKIEAGCREKDLQSIKDDIKEDIKPAINSAKAAIKELDNKLLIPLWSIVGANVTGIGFFILNGIFKWITFP